MAPVGQNKSSPSQKSVVLEYSAKTSCGCRTGLVWQTIQEPLNQDNSELEELRWPDRHRVMLVLMVRNLLPDRETGAE